ncbi:PQQ-like beta-propeller repeat protein [Streptomyces swartbergensis]|uniref:Pyrrolo-quinoline quinone repeat domain-containing protein n=1 Tax=Streptomyces swartbergensis TaxID=487165 RepID=A0A243RNJ3_9ACTN|nr:PQQ-like beta-propeller repeat protein [Streptomyces swartbergensis]OUC95832.1 hypothetical protein CA983_32695 [Streptomyces swartbergensis]
MKPRKRGSENGAKENRLSESEFHGPTSIQIGNNTRQFNVYGSSLALLALLAAIAVLLAAPWKKEEVPQKEKPRRVTPSKVEQGGRFYVADDAGFLSALDPATGKELWSFHPRGAISVSHISGGGRVYASALGRASNALYALDAYNGDPIWSIDEGCVGHPIGTGPSSLIVDTGSAICALDDESGAKEWEIEGEFADSFIDLKTDTLFSSGDHTLRASNITNGSIRWQVSAEQGEILAATEKAVIVESEARLRAFDPRTGGHKWSRKVEELERGGVATPEAMFLFSDATGLHALHTDTGHDIWRLTEGVGNPVYSKGTVYTATEEGVVALSGKTGRKMWNVEVADNDKFSSLQYHKGLFAPLDMLYLVNSAAAVAFFPTDGAVAWKARIERELVSSLMQEHSLLAAQGAVLVREGGNDVKVFDTASGHVRWTYTARGQIEKATYSGSPGSMEIIDRIL